MPRYDLTVIGAGIHGAAVAREAAGRGHRVLMVEQYAQAGLGTSSKSSKLIHGGLRYLESGQFRLVRECLAERRRLLEQQPDLVKLVPFHIPIYRSTRRGTWLITSGLMLYALLGGKGFSRVPRREWPQLDGLQREGLRTVLRYWDAQTDDRLLTERICAQAQRLGSELRYDTTLLSASRIGPGHWQLSCATGDARIDVETRCVVNASGPWANQSLAKFTPTPTMLPMQMVQGTHIVVPGTPHRGVYYLEAPADQRAVFVMPWKGQTLIGTTETPYQGDPGDSAPLPAEITYLLDTRNHYFSPALPRTAVLSSFSGLRLLPVGDSTLFKRRRDTLLHRDPAAPEILTIYGGKLTSHHHTAERVIARLGL